MTAVPTDSLVPLRATGTRPPLYCVHPVSGSPYCYAGLLPELGEQQPVFGLEAPGFDGIAEPAGSIQELADLHTATIRAARPHGPYHLLGWSLGGVVAYEMARLLVAAGEEVPLLVIVDAAVPRQVPLLPEDALVRHFLHDFLGVTSGQAIGLDTVLSDLPPEADAEERFTAVEHSGLIPEEFDAELLLERYTLFRAHASAMPRHRIESVHDGPTTLIKAAESEPGLLHWQPFASRLTEHTVPGDHHSIWQGPGLTAIGGIVSKALNEGTSA